MKRRLAAVSALVLATIALPSPSRASDVPAPERALPGPAVMSAPLATAAQMENADGWSAPPLLVSGTDAHVAGEYLYQDFIYDDHGADTTPAPASPNPEPDSNLFGASTGDVVYPTSAAAYRFNAADLLELRARPTPEGIAYRITLNTMTAPDLAAVAIGIDTDSDAGTGASDWGYGIGSLGYLGLEHVIVAWGTGAELDGAPVSSTVDVARNQIEVLVPLQPGAETWRHFAVTGLFDADVRRFRAIADAPTATAPGGAQRTTPPPVFNVAFRFGEPMGAANTDAGNLVHEIGEAATLGSRGVGYGHWREHAQATALAARDISSFSAEIDFGALRAGATRTSVPRTGYLSRLYSSHQDLGEGVDGARNVLVGQVQPYALYVPTTYDPRTPAPLHVLLAGTTSTYNLFGVTMPNLIRQLGEERRALLLMVEARGPQQSFNNEAELDVFEAMGDVLARYRVDRDRITVGGYSRGGYGTYKMLSQYPDVFARGFAIVGTTGPSVTDSNRAEITPIAVNMRNNPLLLWVGTNDELAPITVTFPYSEHLRSLGYRHEIDVFAGFDHFMLAVLDEWAPGRDFLNGAQAERAPGYVTYRAVPAMDAPEFGLVHDKSYWVSDIRVTPGATSGTVDARSHATGVIPPMAREFNGASADPAPHLRRGVRWQSIGTRAPQNGLDLSLTNVASVTIWADDTGLDLRAPLRLTTDSTHDATVTLVGGGRARVVQVPAGASTSAWSHKKILDGMPTCRQTCAMPDRRKATLSLDAELFRMLEVAAAREGKPAHEIVEEALRERIGAGILVRARERTDISARAALAVSVRETRAVRKAQPNNETRRPPAP